MSMAEFVNTDYSEVKREVVDALLRRRSLVAAKLTEPGPVKEDLKVILRCGTRVPDHGMLTPWRIRVVSGEDRRELGRVWADIFKRKNPAASNELLDFEYRRPLRAPVLLIVSSKIENERVPEWEQILSGAAVCQNILIATMALGYHAQWLSEWPNYDEDVKEALGLAPKDYFLGFIYIGSCSESPKERPRPALDEVVSWGFANTESAMASG